MSQSRADSRREFLQRLVEEDGARWRTQTEGAFKGDHRAATLNASYRFVDGQCTEVARHGTNDPKSPLLGMKILGWLFEDASGTKFSDHWRENACAILWSTSHDSLALTSPTLEFREAPRRDAKPASRAPIRFGTREDSQTRIHVARTA